MSPPAEEARIERIEVFLDHDVSPFAVLSAPPFRLRLETQKVSDGAHHLRFVTVFKDGDRSTRSLDITVRNRPPLLSEGIGQGDWVSGVVDVDLYLAPERVRPAGGPSEWLRAAAVVVVLVGFWAVIAFVPGRSSKKAAPKENSRGGPIDRALLREGAGLYGQKCALCHQENGEGVPSAYPPLAGNPSLADADHVIRVIAHGLSGPLTVHGQTFHGQMPPLEQLTDEQLAAIATYVRNHFGNHFGGVSTADVKAARRP